MKAKRKPVSQYHPYADKVTRDFANGDKIAPELMQYEDIIRIRLQALEQAANLHDLYKAGVPSRKLNDLRWERRIRGGGSFRICFNWDKKEGPYNIQITDHYRIL